LPCKKISKHSKEKKICRDYSGIPRTEWYWKHGRYNDYTAITTKAGIRYIVDDFWDSHGAGFQTYSEFLEKGPFKWNYMPKDIEHKLKAFILQNRRGGGSFMVGQIEVISSEIKTWRVFISFDRISISLITEPLTAKNNPLDLFKGDFPPGHHILSWAIIFDIIQQVKSQWIVYGKCDIDLAAEDHEFRLEAEYMGKEDEMIVVRAFYDKRQLDTFDNNQFAYFG